MLVLVNGRQVYLDHYGYTAWSTIPVQLSEIRQIEVVKGPNTALFGFNAVSGVINIVTYNPLYDDESSAGVTVGNQDYRQASYVQSLKLNDKAGVRISAGKRESSGFDAANANGITTLTNTTLNQELYTDPEQESLNVDAMIQVSDKSQLRIEVSGSNVTQSDYMANGSIFLSDYETKAGKLSYEADTTWGLVKLNAYKNFLDWHALPSTATDYADITNKVTVVQLEDTVQIDNANTVRIGTEFRRNEISGDVFLDPAAEVSYDVYALSAMWNWQINDQLSWTNAGRVDHLKLDHNGQFTAPVPYTADDFSENTTEFSYNSGLLWKPTAEDTVRLGTSRGLEVPSLLEYALDGLNGALTSIGNPNLKPVVVTNYELGWDRKIDAIENGAFRSAVFYQNSKNIKSLMSTMSAPLFLTENIGDSDTYGIELGLGGSMNQKFTWDVGYIFQEINDDLRNKAANGTLNVPKEYEDANPQHQVKVKLGYEDGPWEADTLAYYVSSTDQVSWAESFSGGNAQDEVDGYIGLNARVGYTFDNDVTLAVSAMNLQSAETQTSPAADVERRVFVSLSKKF